MELTIYSNTMLYTTMKHTILFFLQYITDQKFAYFYVVYILRTNEKQDQVQKMKLAMEVKRVWIPSIHLRSKLIHGPVESFKFKSRK